MRQRRRPTAPQRLAARSCLSLFAFLSAAVAPSITQTAVANGDTRTIRLFHVHTKETIEATYRVNGQYDANVLKQLNWFLRDWRRDEPTSMDPRLFDVVWEVYRAAGAGGEYVTVMSAYRSPETNAMLRRRSRAVAEFSQHMLGKAMDTSMPGMSMSQIREIGMKLQRGGVGYYPTAGTPFVHLDVGSVRSWPRMSYDQLVRLFPDGKTVHLPTNGQPLARYEEARAEIAAGGGAAPPSSGSTGFFAWLFGGGSSAGEDEDAAPAPAPRQVAGRRGRGAVQMASLMPRPAATASAFTSPDDSGRDFFASQSARAAAPPPAAPAPSVAQAAANLPRGETFAAAAPAPATVPPAAAPAAPPARTIVASLSPVEQRAAQPEESAPPAVVALEHPAPPRRPSDLALVLDAPMPPARPVEFASLAPAVPVGATAYAGADPGLRRDPIGAIISRDAPPPTAARKPAATASLAPQPPFRPAARAEPPSPIVSARLDRSNFRAMTGHEPASRMTTHSVSGPTFAAARSAARAEAAMLAPASVAATAFGAKATDLPTQTFAKARDAGR